ncbi:MAG: ribosome small subunit-dependent GTPase A [Sandaracinaceae bacterium]
MPATEPGIVLRAQSGQYWVQTDTGVVHCTIRGRLKQGRATSDLAVIGDRVGVVRRDGEPGEGTLESVEPRRTRFARRQPGGRGRYKEDVLIANLDRLFVVFACSAPAMNPRLLDRFLVLAELDGIDAHIVANKRALVDEADARAQFGPYATLGYPVHYTDALAGIGVHGLQESMRGQVSAFVGPSGVGKSSLLNVIQPGLGAAVGGLRESDATGRHTTRVAELFALEHGGYLADTPGIRELAAFSLPADELAGCFPEMRRHLGACRFADCGHDTEPGCAVKAAVEGGAISAARYDSYLRIRRGDER